MIRDSDDVGEDLWEDSDDEGDDLSTLHICHNHHNRWLCKSFESSVKFSTGYMKESALSVICYSVQSYTIHMVLCFTHLAILHNV